MAPGLKRESCAADPTAFRSRSMAPAAVESNVQRTFGFVRSVIRAILEEEQRAEDLREVPKAVHTPGSGTRAPVTPFRRAAGNTIDPSINPPFSHCWLLLRNTPLVDATPRHQAHSRTESSHPPVR